MEKVRGKKRKGGRAVFSAPRALDVSANAVHFAAVPKEGGEACGDGFIQPIRSGVQWWSQLTLTRTCSPNIAFGGCTGVHFCRLMGPAYGGAVRGHCEIQREIGSARRLGARGTSYCRRREARGKRMFRLNLKVDLSG